MHRPDFAVKLLLSDNLLLSRCLPGSVQYSANNGVVYIYGPPGFEPQRWGLPGNPYQPAMSSLPADYVEVFQ